MDGLFKAIPPKNVAVGVGSALVDICLRETESFLQVAGAHKGGRRGSDAGERSVA